MPDKKGKIRILTKLFFTMLYISTFTFGGGFVIVTFMKKKFVDEYQWIDEEEMLDMTALAQSSPGAIAVNAAILIGWKIAGLPGMAAAVAGTVIPPIVILSVISFFYKQFASNRYVALTLKGMQAGVAAVIMDVVFSLGKNTVREKSVYLIVIMLLSFVCAFVFKINVIYIILAAMAAGIIRSLAGLRKRRKDI